MARSTAPSSRARTTPEGRRIDVRDWMGGSRFSGFMGIMLGLVVLAALVLVPTVGTYVEQRQQIAALERSVEATRDEVAALETQREQWKDEAYITAQARERLYYRRPGEVVYLVVNDLPDGFVAPDQAPVSDQVEETKTDWMTQLLGSVTESGLARTVAPD
ncbi:MULTISPECIES: septum formation initiator family protein [unclassified Microbacterium]|uniref:septum formation initiator family protein n=1 Tax=unclassified Microbacterium TaxID=2609290 RepID=UPI00386B4F16